MKQTRTRRHAGWMMLLMAVVATAAQAQQAGKEAKAEDKPPMIKIVPTALLERLMTFKRSATPCPVKAGTVCDIEVFVIQVPENDPDAKKYCVAAAPDVNVKTDTSDETKRRITWRLVDAKDASEPKAEINALEGKPLAFHVDAGIVIATDAKWQIDRRGQRFKFGDETKWWRYRMWTRRNVKDAEATYLPVILWGDPGKEELCAAIDPKIVNI